MPMIGFAELLIVCVLSLSFLVLGVGALWLITRLLRSQSGGDGDAAEILAEMRDGMARMEARLESLEEVMLDPETATARRHN